MNTQVLVFLIPSRSRSLDPSLSRTHQGRRESGLSTAPLSPHLQALQIYDRFESIVKLLVEGELERFPLWLCKLFDSS